MDSAVSSSTSSSVVSTPSVITSHYSSSYDDQIQDIPASLMVPPLQASGTSAVASTIPSQLTAVPVSSVGKQEIKELHQELGSMHSQVVREADVLHNLHHTLSIKAHEMDRLKAEINQLEKAESVAQRSSTSIVSGPNVSSRIHERDDHFSNQHLKYSTNPLVEEFRTRLQMTTELCAKQDAYYRDIVSELEERLQETVQGRDHILALRDKEASDQVSLMRQLENALRIQQQLTTSKTEEMATLEEKLKHMHSNCSSLLSIVNKISQVIINQERKRGRQSLLEGQELQAKEFPSNMGDVLLQSLQKCMYDESADKEQLTANLEKVSRDFKDLENEMEAKLKDAKTDYEAKLNKMKKEHQESMDKAILERRKTNEKLSSVEHQLEQNNKQHSKEVSELTDKCSSLQKELEGVAKQKNDIVSQMEKKSIDLERDNHSITVELKLLREEKEKLLSTLSQEQASNITLKNNLSSLEDELKSTKERVSVLSNENEQNRSNLKKEVENYRLEAEKYKTLLLDRERGWGIEAEKEIQNAIRNEQLKAEERLNILLYELKKVNNELLAVKSQYELGETELHEIKLQNQAVKDELAKTERELFQQKEEKLKIESKLDIEVAEKDRLRKELELQNKNLEEKCKEVDAANINLEKTKTQLEEREKTIASFREQDGYFAEILQRNTKAGDSLQREREELVKKVQEQGETVQELKKHREILARKLKAKDKRLKEVEEENVKFQKSFTAKSEELSAIMEDRSNMESELKARQLEVGNLRQERDTLSNLLEGKDGEREKEISKLLSRLKGSEQDLCLTKKLLRSKGDVSGKAVRVAESMQRAVTEKRGEMDALLNKIHWLQENLNAAVKDKMYFESKSSKLSDELHDAVVRRDQFQFDLKQKMDECDAYQKQVSHLELALEKAALKFADSQGVVERLEQECAKLKLKNTLDMKNSETKAKGSTIKVDSQTIAEVLARVSAMNTRLPVFTSQFPQSSPSITQQKTPIMAHPITLRSFKPSPVLEVQPKPVQSVPKQDGVSDDVHHDLKSLLLDVRTLISTVQPHVTTVPTPAKHLGTAPQHDDKHRAERPLENACAMQQFDENELDISLDEIDADYHGNMRPPLRSSSPKPDRDISMATSHDESPSKDDSDVTSLLSLSSTQSLGINGGVDSNFTGVSDSRDVYAKPSKMEVKKRPIPNRTEKATRTTHSKTHKHRTAKDTKSITKSPPSYEKAEEMLRSLAETGNRLTKKNKEISRLLQEQDLRIQQCRDNEHEIHSLLQ